MPTGPELCECEAQISTAVARDAGGFFNLRTCIQHDLSRHDERVETDHSGPFLAVVEQGHAYLARVVEGFVEVFAVAAGLLHADAGGDVPLGEACPDG
jgi:hypothetical protein